jgi:hypothetical protein
MNSSCTIAISPVWPARTLTLCIMQGNQPTPPPLILRRSTRDELQPYRGHSAVSVRSSAAFDYPMSDRVPGHRSGSRPRNTHSGRPGWRPLFTLRRMSSRTGRALT